MCKGLRGSKASNEGGGQGQRYLDESRSSFVYFSLHDGDLTEMCG